MATINFGSGSVVLGQIIPTPGRPLTCGCGNTRGWTNVATRDGQTSATCGSCGATARSTQTNNR